MKNNILLILLFFLIHITINGQTQEATTSYGQKVILNANGTWKYAEEATTSDGKKIILNADGTWKCAEIKKDTSITGGIISGTGEAGVSYNLAGRGFQKLPPPKYDYQGGGRVVVEISVDRNGNVTQAIPGAKGSTTLDEYLLKVAKEAAMEAKFETKRDAPPIQKGTIAYNFILK
jgi:TonB family protein